MEHPRETHPKMRARLKRLTFEMSYDFLFGVLSGEMASGDAICIRGETKGRRRRGVNFHPTKEFDGVPMGMKTHHAMVTYILYCISFRIDGIRHNGG